MNLSAIKENHMASVYERVLQLEKFVLKITLWRMSSTRRVSVLSEWV
jgi:hypothetical protein